jgi:hypothetical protein
MIQTSGFKLEIFRFFFVAVTRWFLFFSAMRVQDASSALMIAGRKNCYGFKL